MSRNDRSGGHAYGHYAVGNVVDHCRPGTDRRPGADLAAGSHARPDTQQGAVAHSDVAGNGASRADVGSATEVGVVVDRGIRVHDQPIAQRGAGIHDRPCHQRHADPERHGRGHDRVRADRVDYLRSGREATLDQQEASSVVAYSDEEPIQPVRDEPVDFRVETEHRYRKRAAGDAIVTEAPQDTLATGLEHIDAHTRVATGSDHQHTIGHHRRDGTARCAAQRRTSFFATQSD